MQRKNTRFIGPMDRSTEATTLRTIIYTAWVKKRDRHGLILPVNFAKYWLNFQNSFPDRLSNTDYGICRWKNWDKKITYFKQIASAFMSTQFFSRPEHGPPCKNFPLISFERDAKLGCCVSYRIGIGVGDCWYSASLEYEVVAYIHRKIGPSRSAFQGHSRS